MRILALDLGKFKTAACISVDGEVRFRTEETTRTEFTRLLQNERPDVAVFEACTAARWVADLCEELGLGGFVANPNGEAWRWSKIKRTTDRDDALKLVRLTAMNDPAHLPGPLVRR